MRLIGAPSIGDPPKVKTGKMRPKGPPTGIQVGAYAHIV